MATLSAPEKRIKAIEERNSRVEKDKAWETSYFRKIVLIILAYLAVGLYLSAINVNNAWVNAIVPSLGFMLSTLTLPFLKKLWERYLHNKGR